MKTLITKGIGLAVYALGFRFGGEGVVSILLGLTLLGIGVNLIAIACDQVILFAKNLDPASFEKRNAVFKSTDEITTQLGEGISLLHSALLAKYGYGELAIIQASTSLVICLYTLYCIKSLKVGKEP